MNNWKRTALMACSCGVLLASAACTLDHPTYYNKGQIEVREQRFAQEYVARTLNDSTIASMAQEYYKAGSGDLNVTVSYDPQSKTHTARNAAQLAADIASAFGRNGVSYVKTDILPVLNSGESMAYISFNYLEAHAPENCGRLDTMDDSAHENFREYELGCTTDTFLAQQVANPADLLGRAVSQDSIGRRDTNIVDAHKAGVPRAALEGESTTGD